MNTKTVRVDSDALAAFNDAISVARKTFEEQTGLSVGDYKYSRQVHYNRVAEGVPVMDSDIVRIELTDIDGRAILLAPTSIQSGGGAE